MKIDFMKKITIKVETLHATSPQHAISTQYATSPQYEYLHNVINI